MGLREREVGAGARDEFVSLPSSNLKSMAPRLLRPPSASLASA